MGALVELIPEFASKEISTQVSRGLPLHQLLHFHQFCPAFEFLVYAVLDAYPEAVSKCCEDKMYPLHICALASAPTAITLEILRRNPSVAGWKDLGGRVPFTIAVQAGTTDA